MTVASAIQMTSTDNVQDNLKQAQAFMMQAVDQNAQLIVLPEMFATMHMDTVGRIGAKEQFGQGVIQDFLQSFAQKYKTWIVGGTLPVATDSPQKIHATCFVYNAHGEYVTHYNKIHLFDVTVVPGKEEYKESSTTIPGDAVIVIDTPVGKLGLAVCYDIRFPELFRIMFNQGAEVFALPAAFTYITGLAHWEILLRARAIESQSYMIGACQGGIHPGGRHTFGHSMIVSPWGKILGSLDETPGVISADINLNDLQDVRARIPVKQHQQFFTTQVESS